MNPGISDFKTLTGQTLWSCEAAISTLCSIAQSSGSIYWEVVVIGGAHQPFLSSSAYFANKASDEAIMIQIPESGTLD